MPNYSYTARNMSGKTFKGILNADSERVVRARLHELNLYAASVTKTRRWNLAKRPEKVKARDVSLFCEEFSAMLDAGFSVDKSLMTLEKQMDNETLKQAIKDIRADIEKGMSLSNSLAKYSHIFPDLFVNMVRAGEVGGVLPNVLHRLATYLNREKELRQKMRSAFTYPVVVSVLIVVVVTFLLIFIIPRFTAVYRKLGVNLPFITMVLVWSSHIVRRLWWAILVSVPVLAFGFIKFKSSESGSLILDQFKLRLPIFGKLISMGSISRFLSAFAALVNSGTSTMQSLDIAGQIPDNKVIRDFVRKIRKSVYSGGKISDPLLAGDLFPPVVVQMIASGEESGTLPDMLDRAAGILDRNVDGTVEKVVVIMEPVMTMFLAVVVGFIAVAIYLPMFDLIGSMHR